MADPQPEPKGTDEAATWRGVSTILAVVAALAVGYAMVATRLSRPAPAPPAPAPQPAAAPEPAAPPPAVAEPARAPRPAPRDPPPAAPDAATPAPVTAAGRVAAGDCSGANDLIAWGCRAPVPGLSCARVVRAAAGGEPEASNYLCAVPEAALRWLDARPGAGSECSQVMVPQARNAWSGAFLCVASAGPLALRVSFARPIDGADCVEGWEPWAARRGTQNYLCWSARPRPADARDGGID